MADNPTREEPGRRDLLSRVSVPAAIAAFAAAAPPAPARANLNFGGLNEDEKSRLS